MSKTPVITNAERAVYELIKAGRMNDPAYRQLYRREIRTLGGAGLIQQTADGALVPVLDDATAARTGSSVAVPITPPEPIEPMGTLTCRVPLRILAELDAIGMHTRSEAARVVLERLLTAGSGSRPAVRKATG